MSKMRMTYRCHETTFDKDGNIVADYDANLPHHDLIGKRMVKSFNDARLEQHCDGILKGNVETIRLSFHKNTTGESIATITITGKLGFRLTENRRNAIVDYIDSQLCDGWGEGFFGYANIMTDDDGNKFMVE